MLAAYVARKLQLTLQFILKRAKNATQRNFNHTKRIAQAKQAFQADSAKVITDWSYLIIDDVVTTGATMPHAALALRQAGACEVWAAIIAPQPLD